MVTGEFQELNPEVLAEAFWEGIKEEVSRELRDILMRVNRYDRKKSESQTDLEDDLRGGLEKEKGFVVRVLSAVEEAKKTSDNIILLFDVDETIARKPFRGEGYIRPSLIPVLEKVTSKGVAVGLLTNRGKEVADDSLESGSDLGSIGAFFDRDIVFSSRGHNKVRADFDFTIEGFRALMLKKFGGVVGEAELDQGSDDCCGVGDLEKLSALSEIKEQYPDRSIIVVDDLAYPRFLGEDKGLYGVSLKEEGRFEI